MEEQMKEFYKELYSAYGELKEEQRRSVFFSMVGERYKENRVRFMLVGRAVNGWKKGDEYTSAEDFSNRAMKHMNDTGRWKWVENDNGRLITGGKTAYSLERSRFWNYSREIYKHLAEGCNKPDARIWMDNILWSNLYRISPESGNPSGSSQKKQKEACAKILNAEIEYFKPTHILLVTGYDYWLSNFPDIQEKLPKHTGVYIEAKGDLNGAKAIVTKRPERAKKFEYVQECIEAFNSIL